MWPFPKKKTYEEQKSEFFNSKNAVLEEIENHEFNGNKGLYVLKITPFKTGKNTWNYTRGEIFLDDISIAVVDRNYSSFPFEFVKHPNGHDYIVCGEDYQGQTIIELDTRKRKDTMSTGSEDGNGFCWASIEFINDKISLSVIGCEWGGEYEEKIIDFSDPFNMVEIKN